MTLKELRKHFDHASLMVRVRPHGPDRDVATAFMLLAGRVLDEAENKEV